MPIQGGVPPYFTYTPRYQKLSTGKKIFCKKFSKTGRLLCMQYKTSRKEALAAGDIRYLGGPCKYGHKGLRCTRNYTCVECNRVHTKQHQQKIPERRRELRKAYRKRYPEKIKASHARHRAYKINRIPKWITPKDIKAMKKLYAQATRKTLATGVKYHVDHIIPLRGKLVSGLHVPSNLQVISAKENLVKNNTYICE